MSNNKQSLRAQIETARRVSTPIIGISTADYAGTVREICTAVKPEYAVLSWNVVEGIHSEDATRSGINTTVLAGLAAQANCTELKELAMATENPVALLVNVSPTGEIKMLWNDDLAGLLREG